MATLETYPDAALHDIIRQAHAGGESRSLAVEAFYVLDARQSRREEMREYVAGAEREDFRWTVRDRWEAINQGVTLATLYGTAIKDATAPGDGMDMWPESIY